MASELRVRQEAEWQILYDRIAAFLERYGTNGYKCGADFYLVEENFDMWRQTVEAHNLKLLDPAVVKQLQDLLAGYPDWEVQILLALDDKITEPEMGLMIAEDEIIDGLQRDLLPPEFRELAYPGSKTREPWC